MEKGPGRISPATEASGLANINTEVSNLVITTEDNEET